MSTSVRPHLLIIDDDIRAGASLKLLLSDLGDVSFYTDGAEALSWLPELNPDLILLNAQMPDINGYQICSIIKKQTRYEHTPVIFVTGMTDVAAQTRAFEVGAVDLIAKPYNISIVKARIKTHLTLKRKNEELLEKEQLLREMVEKTPAAIAMLDMDMRYLALSTRYLEDYRLSESDLLGRCHYDVFPEIPDRWREIHQRALGGETISCAEDPFPRIDGKTDWVSWEIKPWYSGNNIAGLLLFSEVITARKEAKERENRLMAIYHALSETNEAILHLQDEPTLFHLVCRIATEYGQMTLAWVGIPDSNNRIIPVAKSGEAVGHLEGIVVMATADVPEGRGPTGTAYREIRTVAINDISKDSSVTPWSTQAGLYNIRSSAAFPIQRAGKPYATFSVYSDQVGAFDEEIVRLLQEMASNISFALDNLDKEAKRKEAEEALRLTQYSLEIAVDPVFWVRPDGSFQYFNDAACRYLGYSREEMLNLTIMDIDLAVTSSIWTRIWEQEKQYQSRKFETEHRAKDGHLIPVEISTNRVEYNNQEYIFAFVRDISERKKSEELIWKQANFDSLTGLPNRHMFLGRLEQEVINAQRTGLALAVMFLDMDHFKDINDTMGHGIGDRLLKIVAERIASCVRDVDTVARIGGDEFTIILSNLHDKSSADRVSQVVLNKLAEPFQLENEAAYVSASIGITFYPDDASDSEGLLKNADQAMYAAKSLGRNRYSYYDATMQEAALSRHQLIKHMHSALEQEQFYVVYQPIVELATGSISKAEALLRWRHPDRGLISPAEFIPLAEQSGLIVEIGHWVFQQAARQVKELRDRYHPNFQISVNKSPVQFRKNKSQYETWIDYLMEIELLGDGIVIEITESLLMDSTGFVTDKLKAFRSMGMQISLDDFGTGYSSLSYIQKFDLDYLKIDQSFVQNLTPQSENMALCEAIIVMAHKLGIKVIAEGVETEEQRKLLADAGCDYAQGYLFSKPVPADEFEELLKADSFHHKKC